MGKRQPASERQGMPLFGEIVAGPLSGWRYSFGRFVCIDGALYLDLQCTPPLWPFPQTVRFDMKRDKFTLRAVPGERARRLDALALMAAAMEHGASATPLED